MPESGDATIKINLDLRWFLRLIRKSSKSITHSHFHCLQLSWVTTTLNLGRHLYCKTMIEAKPATKSHIGHVTFCSASC